jgi:hypothetical protein
VSRTICAGSGSAGLLEQEQLHPDGVFREHGEVDTVLEDTRADRVHVSRLSHCAPRVGPSRQRCRLKREGPVQKKARERERHASQESNDPQDCEVGARPFAARSLAAQKMPKAVRRTAR